jgi:hypothetical protein
MTERKWLNCKNMFDLLDFLNSGKWERKLRLVACGCCRRLCYRLPDQQSRRAVETAEQFADGLLDDKALAAAHESACAVVREVGILHPVHAAAYAASPNVKVAAYSAFQNAHDDGEQFVDKAQWQLALVYDVFGNPFRSVAFTPAWLAWNDSTIPKLAQAIYNERAFDRMPILADALEEAGCTNLEILNHCRQPGEHARGCWVIDALLGKS